RNASDVSDDEILMNIQNQNQGQGQIQSSSSSNFSDDDVLLNIQNMNQGQGQMQSSSSSSSSPSPPQAQAQAQMQGQGANTYDQLPDWVRQYYGQFSVLFFNANLDNIDKTNIYRLNSNQNHYIISATRLGKGSIGTVFSGMFAGGPGTE